jgi:hypothetical protein
LLVEKSFDQALGFGPEAVVAVVEFGEVQVGLSKKIFSRKGAKARRCGDAKKSHVSGFRKNDKGDVQGNVGKRRGADHSLGGATGLLLPLRVKNLLERALINGL